jgi:hypothetical protein
MGYSMFDQYDVMILTETFLRKEHCIPGFYSKQCFASQNGRGRPMRGISIYYNAKLGYLNSHFILENFVILNFHNLTIVGSYLHPNMNSSVLANELVSSIKYISNFQNLIFAGDFNCRLDTKNNKIDAFMDFANLNDLKLANSLPFQSTYVCANGSSVVDLILLGSKIKQLEFKVQDSNFRKHNMVNLKISVQTLSHQQGNKRKSSLHINKPQLEYLIDNKYRQTLRSVIEEENIEKFNREILNLLREATSQPNNYVRRSQPWFNRECFQLKERLDILREEIKTARSFGFHDLVRQLLPRLSSLKKEYSQLCKQAKINYQQKFEEGILREAENENRCYKILKLNKSFSTTNNIQLEDWEQSFTELLNTGSLESSESLNLKNMLHDHEDNVEYINLLEEEVLMASKKMKNGKASGPDNVKNEHVKMLIEFLLPEITKFFNLCLKQGTYPEGWRYSHLKLLFKGKGDLEDKNSYRGISVGSVLYNLLDRILHNRIYSSLIEYIPKNQYGFVRGRNTLQAVKKLVGEINLAVYEQGKPLYALFLDVKKAFDSVDREFVFKKIIETGKLSLTELKFISHTLDLNFLNIIDGVSISSIIVQSNGVRQGGCTSPFFFNFSIATLSELLKDFPTVKVIFYADDIVLTSTDLDDLKAALQFIKEYLLARKLELNLGKCKVMKFRNKGKGRYKLTDKLQLDGVNIEFVTEFTYLGVVFQPSGISFNKHIEKRVRAALLATYNIPQLQSLSIETASKLFDLKVSPIASYAIEEIWPFLSKNDLDKLESVKTRYFKRVLGLSKFNRSRFVYALLDFDLFVSDLKQKFALPDTFAFDKFCEANLVKQTEICDEFYTTCTMENTNWKSILFEDRHVFTRFACHGYHYLFCKNQNFHFEAKAECMCEYCNESCDQYHLTKCTVKKVSLREAAKIIKKH